MPLLRHGIQNVLCCVLLHGRDGNVQSEMMGRQEGPGLKRMSIEISRETEARLANEAERLGISVDALLKRFIDEHATVTRAAHARPSLPLWHLGGAGAMHRRDIYDDVH